MRGLHDVHLWFIYVAVQPGLPMSDPVLSDPFMADPFLADPDVPAAVRADFAAAADILPVQPGQRLARGVARALRALDFVCVEEFTLATGLRVDLMALGPKGEVWVVECKSGLNDFRGDRKWQGYLEFCDRFFWAVDVDFPTEALPEGTGLILADAYDGEIVRMGPHAPLAGARRKALMHSFARAAALRLQAFRDPALAI